VQLTNLDNLRIYCVSIDSYLNENSVTSRFFHNLGGELSYLGAFLLFSGGKILHPTAPEMSLPLILQYTLRDLSNSSTLQHPPPTQNPVSKVVQLIQFC
jgi:hypothetical protein